ncbi:MAG: NUDIX hydrolase N-terminal domain-containing protein [Acidimicrobiales bacterium]
MSDEPLTEIDLIRWSQALAGIARTGLGFTESRYERERFEEVLAVAADIHAAATRRHDPADVVDEWLRIVGSGVAGYVTPKVAVGAVVGNEDGEILLIQRSDSGVWLYPTGWADVGYSPAEVALKEVREETGIEAEVSSLIGVFDGLRRGFSRTPLYSLVFHCRAVGGELDPHPLECLDVGWFGRDRLPEPLAGGALWVERAFAAIGGDDAPAYFDEPRMSVWLEGQLPD